MKKFLSSLLVTGMLMQTVAPYSVFAETKTPEVVVETLAPLAVPTFSDVKEGDWHYDFVTNMATAGYVTGNTDGSYTPDNGLLAAEFATMIANGFYGETLAELRQTEGALWWSYYMDACLARNGFIGTSMAAEYAKQGNTWGETPFVHISRYDMSAMISNLLGAQGVTPLTAEQVDEVLSLMTDTIDPAYQIGVATAYYYDFLQGRKDGSFDGTASLTRAEAAVVLSGLVSTPMLEKELAEDYMNPTEDEESEEDVEEPEETAPAPEEDSTDSDSADEEETEEDFDDAEGDLSDPDESESTEGGAPVPEEETTPEETDPNLPTQEELGTWVTNTILGSTSPNSYVYNETNGIYVKDMGKLGITVDDLTKSSAVTLDKQSYEPQILIYHTHGTESFTQTPTATYTETGNYRTTDRDHSVMAVGAAMAQVFRDAGYVVLHETERYHDYPSYSDSYDNSNVTLTEYTEKYPSLKLVIDLHRDGLEKDGVPYQLVSQQGDETLAQVMLFVGSNGGGFEHPNWQSENFALALALQEGLLEYGDFARPITLAGSRYNQYLSPGAILLEVGNHGNTLEQAIAAGELFAQSAIKTMS